MNPRITSIENTVARDPGGRNIFELALTDQLRLAAQSLRLARRVGVVSGFFIPKAGAGETDGPPGAKTLGDALTKLGITVDYITDRFNAPLFEAMGVAPRVNVDEYLTESQVTHLVSVERLGRSADGRYRDMGGRDITDHTAPLDELFVEATRRGLTTIGIGDGGNEIGMGKVFAEALSRIEHGRDIACTIPTDFCIAAGVSNWGAYGLAGALSVLEGCDLLPTAEEAARQIELVVQKGGAVDGVTGQRSPTVDGLALGESLRMLETVRRQILPSPLEDVVPGRGIRAAATCDTQEIGVLGYGEAGKAVASLLADRGHRVRVSDHGGVHVDGATHLAGIETGGHSAEFFDGCDLVVASPGVPADAPIRHDLHRLGIPVVGALEPAYQLCDSEIIAVTGTMGKRTTVKMLQRIFEQCGRELTIGGNKGRPLAELLLDPEVTDPIALAVSSFQLETIVQFRPHIAVFLNLDEAHLDRHRSIAEYARIKSRIFMNHRPDDVLILGFDDTRLRSLARKHCGRTLFVSAHQAMDRGAWLDRGSLYLNVEGDTEELGPAEPVHPENLLSAVLAARLCGLGLEPIRLALREPLS